MTEVYSEGAHLIGEVLYKLTKDLNIEAIGGPAVGAIPLTTATVISYYRHGQLLKGFWVQNKIKTDGTQKIIEGDFIDGLRVAIVDDVLTKGMSALRAVEIVQKLGCEVVTVLALVDRLQGARELFQSHGIKNYRCVFTIKDFGIDPV